MVPESVSALETRATQTPLLGILQMPKDVKTALSLFVKTSSVILSTGAKMSLVIHIRIAVVLANAP
jgi:hypothetical protein